MAELKGACALLLAGTVAFGAASPARSAAVGEGSTSLAAVGESLVDRAEADVVGKTPVAFVPSGLDLGLGRMRAMVDGEAGHVVDDHAESALVGIASTESVILAIVALRAAERLVELPVGTDEPLRPLAPPTEITTLERSIVPVRQIGGDVLPNEPDRGVMGVLNSVLGALRGINELFRSSLGGRQTDA